MASTDTLAVENAPRRRRARLLSALVTVLAVATAAWFALRRRAPALPTFTSEARPGPSTTARPTPPVPAVAPAVGTGPGSAAPVAPVAPAPATQAPAPVAPEPATQAAGAPVGPAPVAPVAPVAPAPVAPRTGGEPTAPSTSSGSEELQRVSGIGRRSAEALVAAGIDSLDRLADSDDATLVAALEAAGLRRSPTLSAWASQARRLARA